MLKLANLAALMPASVLLALSFFVLFTVTKIPQRWLKVFGGLAAGLLIFAALGSLARAAYGGNRMMFREMLPPGEHYRMQMRPGQPVLTAPKAVNVKPSSCKKCQEGKETAVKK